MKKILLISWIILLTGCATHPQVSTTRMKKGDTESGLVYSIENVLPYYYYRKAITDRSNLGFRMGLLIGGAGIDYSRLLYSKENKWDVLNLAWSLNPNYNIDATYYKFYQGKQKGEKPPAVFWWGLRGMYIPKGISGGTSARMGLLIGAQPWARYGFEIGYFHDPNAMPLSKVLSPSWKWDDPENIARYGDTPHISDSGLPSEYSRWTGLSIRFYVLTDKKKNNGSKP